jgi:hypothetical protein
MHEELARLPRLLPDRARLAPLTCSAYAQRRGLPRLPREEGIVTVSEVERAALLQAGLAERREAEPLRAEWQAERVARSAVEYAGRHPLKADHQPLRVRGPSHHTLQRQPQLGVERSW